MKGRIKFFSENEGYGFIHGEDGIEYYFDIHRIKSFTSVPKMGNSVTFDLPVELITELDKVANFYGMNRAQFVSQAVMKAVREVKRTENL